MNRRETLERAIDLVYGERQRDYGSPKDNFRTVAQFWSGYLGYELTDTDVVAMLIMLKLARLRNCENHSDSWVDIAGYAAIGNELSTGE